LTEGASPSLVSEATAAAAAAIVVFDNGACTGRSQ